MQKMEDTGIQFSCPSCNRKIVLYVSGVTWCAKCGKHMEPQSIAGEIDTYTGIQEYK